MAMLQHINPVLLHTR